MMRAIRSLPAIVLMAFTSSLSADPMRGVVTPETVGTLARDLGSPDVEAQRAAAKSAKDFVHSAWRRLVILPPESRRAVAEVLVPALVGALDAPDAKVREHSAVALGNLAGATTILRDYLQDSGKSHLVLDQSAIARAIERPESDSVIKLLHYSGPLTDDVRQAVVRMFVENRRTEVVPAAEVLAARGPEEKKVLFDALRGSESLRSVAARALAAVKLTPDDVRQVLAILESAGDPKAQSWILMAFQGSGEQETSVLEPLIRRLDAPDARVRDEAARLLGRMAPRARELLPKLVALLRLDLGAGAAEAIELIGPSREHLEPLLGVVKDDNATPETRQHSMTAIASLGAAARVALPAIDVRARCSLDDFERHAAEVAAKRIRAAR